MTLPRINGWLIWWGFAGLVTFAFVLMPHQVSAGLLDSIRSGFAVSSAPMEATAARWSLTIFGWLIGLEILWSAFEAIFQNDASWTSNLGLRIFVAAAGASIVTHQIEIVRWMSDEIALMASSFVGSSGPPLSPDGIAMLGKTVSDRIYAAAPQSMLVNIAITLPQFICGTLVGLSYIVIAIERLAIDLGLQLCIALGSILLGFLATRWTCPYAASWPRMIITALMVLVTVNAVAGVGVLIGKQEVDLIDQMNGAGIPSILSNLSTMTGVSLVYLLFGFGLPAFMGWLGASSPMTSGAAIMGAGSMAMGFLGGKSGAASPAGAGAPGRSIGDIKAAAQTS